MFVTWHIHKPCLCVAAASHVSACSCQIIHLNKLLAVYLSLELFRVSKEPLLRGKNSTVLIRGGVIMA
ncbi:Uncharacterised protein [Yersinia pseudotuberculosis]|nr:Uncharacterised protein [Yersinia pseudotuberculosis]CNL49535.1 Uncharacterised protein [Yersinia pseudotuberculosis]